MRHVLTTGLVRGLVGQAVGFALGVYTARAWGATDWRADGPLAWAAVLSVLGFMLASGMVSDWLGWLAGNFAPPRHGAPPGKPRWWRYWSVDYDHKVIGIQYGVTALVLVGLAGSVALIFRSELSKPGIDFLEPAVFNTLIGWHGIVMIAGILTGVAAMANYLVPLMVGARDMAFPRLNAFAYWINVPGVVLVVLALFLRWETGWTGYPPLGVQTMPGAIPFYLGVFVIGFSSILGAVNILATAFGMRAQGMTLFRMPIFVWSMVATSIIALTATQLIGLSFVLVVLERVFGMTFFSPTLTESAQALGSPPGQPLLFQHLFWFYSHPAVYVFILPGLGIISELLPVFARKPLFGYKWVAMASLAIALVGFLVWGHHMFTSGMSDIMRVTMMWTTLLVAVPTGVKFFNWLGTMWGGKLTFPTPMLFVLGALSIFLIGGLSGPPNGTVSTDLFLHDTYWIVGHFHATMFGGFVYPYIAAIYYWYPKVTGRMYNETLGKIHFWLMTPAFWTMSLGQMLAGLWGMRRRIVDYDPALGVAGLQTAVTIAAHVIFLSMLIFAFNLVWSAFRGKVAAANPWRSRSPEFQVPSPVPDENYPAPVVVVSEPYEYGGPEPYVVFAHGPAAADD